LREEFSDLPNVSEAVRVTVRLLIAATLGGALGYEREKSGKAAGLRTHMLVSIGAAIFVLVPQQAGVVPADLTRVLQGLIAGIGFLGAGTIVKGESSDDASVKGLTSAAGIWLTAAIGVAAGIGRATAFLTTFLALIILTVVPRLLSPKRQ